MATLEEQFQTVMGRTESRLRAESHIEKAHYDPKLGRVILDLSTHAWFAFSPSNTPGLDQATPAALKKIEVTRHLLPIAG